MTVKDIINKAHIDWADSDHNTRGSLGAFVEEVLTKEGHLPSAMPDPEQMTNELRDALKEYMDVIDDEKGLGKLSEKVLKKHKGLQDFMKWAAVLRLFVRAVDMLDD